MDTNDIFRDFLENEVNLGETRYKRIKKAEEALPKFIAGTDNFKELFIGATPQGSFRQKTIIKPVDGKIEFDLDLLIELKENEEWKPKDYLETLSKELKKSGLYKEMTDTKGKNRCVTIDYEGDFHVDLVPAIKRNDQYFICNKKDNNFEKTDGDGYAQWFSAKNKAANNHLVNDVRLIKYLRDKNKDFNTKSIIITTLAGMVVIMGKHESLPMSFASILSGLHNILDKCNNPPQVTNPAMPEESFERHWKDDKEGFKKFKSAIEVYSRIANRALVLSDDEAIKEWRKIFGDKFGTLTSEEEGGNSSHARKTSSDNFEGFAPKSPWYAGDVKKAR